MKYDDFRASLSGKHNSGAHAAGTRLLSNVRNFMSDTQQPSSARSSAGAQNAITQTHLSAPPDVEANVLMKFTELPELWLIGSTPVIDSVGPQARPGVHVLPHPALEAASLSLGEVTGVHVAIGLPTFEAYHGEESIFMGAGPSHLSVQSSPVLSGSSTTATTETAATRHHDALSLGSERPSTSSVGRSQQQEASHLRLDSAGPSSTLDHVSYGMVGSAAHYHVASARNAVNTPPANQTEQGRPPGQGTSISDVGSPNQTGKTGHDVSTLPSDTVSSQAQTPNPGMGGQPASLAAPIAASLQSPLPVTSGAESASALTQSSLPDQVPESVPQHQPAAGVGSQSALPGGDLTSPQLPTTDIAVEAGSSISTVPASTSLPTELPSTSRSTSESHTQLGLMFKPGPIISESGENSRKDGEPATSAAHSSSAKPTSTLSAEPEAEKSSTSSYKLAPKHSDPAFVGPETHTSGSVSDSTSYGHAGSGPASILVAWPSVANAIQEITEKSSGHILSDALGQSQSLNTLTPTAFGSLSLPQPASALAASAPVHDLSDPAHHHSAIHIHH